MVFYNESKDEKVLVVTCTCGCEDAIHLKRFVDEDKSIPVEYYLTINSGKFYSEQDGILRIIARRLKRAWKVLRGKDYCCNEIVMKREEVVEMVNQLEVLLDD